jgi:hypothetical protein
MDPVCLGFFFVLLVVDLDHDRVANFKEFRVEFY